MLNWWEADGWNWKDSAAELNRYKRVKRILMCTHLVTGDLLILSGSSVTLKRKTNVSVRNQSTNHNLTANPHPLHFLFKPPPISSNSSSINPQITKQNTTAHVHVTDGSSPVYNGTRDGCETTGQHDTDKRMRGGSSVDRQQLARLTRTQS